MIALRAQPSAPPWRVAGIVAGLSAIVGLRYAITASGVADPLLTGTAFGAGLLTAAFAGGWRPARLHQSSILVGLLGGGVLIGMAVASRSAWLPSMAPPVPFPTWAAVTVLVATGEEVLLRGALFDALEQIGGVAPAVVVTSATFALMHVPLYGWQVVPLDLGVGLWLAGLRLWSGGIAAPAIAHVAADLATWWL